MKLIWGFDPLTLKCHIGHIWERDISWPEIDFKDYLNTWGLSINLKTHKNKP